MWETQDFSTRSNIKNYLVSYYKREVRFLYDYAHETRFGFSGDDFWPSHGNNCFVCVCVCQSRWWISLVCLMKQHVFSAHWSSD